MIQLPDSQRSYVFNFTHDKICILIDLKLYCNRILIQ